MHLNSSVQNYLDSDAKIIAPVQHIAELPLVVKGAEGPYIVSVDDKRYLDFTSGACTMSLGYNAPAKLGFGSFPFPYAVGINQIEYAKALVKKFPGGQRAQIAFSVCGSDTNDAAIKFSRAYTGRKKIVTFEGDYHGTTFGAASLTTLPGRISDKFAPMVGEIYAMPFCNEEDSDEKVDAVIDKIKALNCEEIAGFIIEPIQGDMGMLPMNKKLMKKIYALSREFNIAFIVDEVQMAFYRTGPFFSIENYEGIYPDAITLGKHIGGGIPLGAILGRYDFMQSLGPCEHAFSMAGNSEACARGLYNLNAIENEQFQKGLHRNIKILLNTLASFKDKYPQIVVKFTGIGLAYGLWVKSNNISDTDDKACQKIIAKAFDYGLYTMRIGSNWIRLEPPLNLDEKLLIEGLAILEKAIADYSLGRLN